MTQPVAAPATEVAPNLPGQIYTGDYVFKVNNNYGTIVYKQAAPRVRLRDAIPQPPRSPRGFVGRDKELGELEKLVAASEAIAVCGQDGIGKTALLKRAAHGDAARALPNGVVLVEGVDSTGTALGPGDVIQRLFDALYESDPPLKVDPTTARTYLSNTRPLVLLDNVNLPAAALATLADLFPRGALLVSISLSPTGDAVQRIKLGPLSRPESIALFTSRADVTVSSSIREIVSAICALLGDVPLALVAAANLIRENSLSLAGARATLQSGSAEPAASVEEAVGRVLVLAASILSREEQQVLSIAAATPGLSVETDWLRSMLRDSPALPHSIERLKAMGLLHANSPRLRVDPALKSAGGLAGYVMAVREALPQYLIERLATRALEFDYCADELGNILFAMDVAADPQAIALARAIDPFLVLRGQWDVWKKVLDRALQAARRSGDRAAEAWALHELGTRAMGAGVRDSALASLRQALEIRRAIGDRVAAEYTRHNLAFLLPPGPPPDDGRPRPRPGPKPGLNPWLAGGLLGGIGVTGLLALVVAGWVVINWLRPPPTGPTPPIHPDTTGPEILRPFVRPDLSFYGPDASACGPALVELSMLVRDESRVDTIEVAYRYESAGRASEWHPVGLKDMGGGRYQTVIDNNFDGQAMRALDGLNGSIRWLVIAADEHGNTTKVEEPTAQVNYCQAEDTTGPLVTEQAAGPDPTYYGECGALELTFTVMAEDPSGLARVEIWFRYEGRGTTGWHSVVAQPASENVYRAVINNNQYDPYNQLGAAGGRVRWYAIVVDQPGNQTQTPDRTVSIEYCLG